MSERTKWEMPTVVRASFVFGLIYTFLVGVSSLESGIKVMGADTQESLFSSVSNPVAGLFIGILGTVLVQSSSASTSVIVGLVGTGALGVGDAVPMVMGANIGTTVTNTLVALAHMRQSEEFKRAFAAATVHDFFNLMAVGVLLPIELATGVLSTLAENISSRLVGSAGSEWKSPIKKWVKEPVGWLKDLGDAIGAAGNVLGTFLVIVGLVIILLSLAYITKNMRQLVADRIEASLNRVLGTGAGMVAMVLGLLITISVQSSSITTSIMIPLAAAGVVTLRNIYPVTLGANVGTTITALLAALAASRPEALTVGIVHTLFNLGGIALLYPIPAVRDLPVRAAENLARIAVSRRVIAIAYVVTAFIVIPLLGVAILR
ncbi:MAG: sodium dependent phosphate transporter [Acidimicrobiaceae bacterium]|nr:sodium dependent phosphate transporter [Acidimicrobiaceae bacterium]MBN99868.1 sodium dependent phosphate transporter [Acidimicrobiaceae bacterium]|tara:strand:+ start:660 stop:1787 length:1128 start_codon:yes stop_codon:yes gene_type:complete